MISVKLIVVLGSAIALAAIYIALLSGSPVQMPAPSSGHFSYTQVDPAGPRAPWGKSVGDINGDGLIDLVVGGHQPRRLSMIERIVRKLRIRSYDAEIGELVWYAAPAWEKHAVTTRYAVRTDIEVGDMDGDGRADIVALTDAGLGWFSNPDWTFSMIDGQKLHDVELADIDGDLQLEVVARSQSLFGYENGNEVAIFDRADDGSWGNETLAVPHGEGLLVTDLNGDGRQDIIVNGIGYLNIPSGTGLVLWQQFAYAPSWTWNDVFVGAADFDGDGRVDIALAPSEPVGSRYRISWFRAPDDYAGVWEERTVVKDTESVHHFVGAADFDGDGRADLATAQMTQGDDPDEVAIYLNRERGKSWEKEVLSVSGSHSMRILDANGDLRPDLFGTNWEKEDYYGDYSVDLWINRYNDSADSQWKRHVIDADRPGQAVFIFANDIDLDGKQDVITGGWWYRNPGNLTGAWERRPIGEGANNVALIHDFDNDGRPDLLASGWRGYSSGPSVWQRILNRSGLRPFDYRNPGNEFVWARNAGNGTFTIHSNIRAAKGDFLQGAAVLRGLDEELVVLSWHDSQTSLQALHLPQNRLDDTWTWSELSPHSQHEQVTAADIDGDGIDDIVLGTKWLQAAGNADSWQLKNLHESASAPDRHRVADLNGDGRRDLVIGYEAVSRMGQLAWYEAGPDPAFLWAEHPIAELTGPMSVDVGDLDVDGDLDIVVGEHNLEKPDNARLVWIENTTGAGHGWVMHLIHTGDEHHDGAQAVDIDGDGDLDVLSIGWGHRRVLLYENLRQ